MPVKSLANATRHLRVPSDAGAPAASFALGAILLLLQSCARPPVDLDKVYLIGTDNAYPYHFVDKSGQIHGMTGEVIQEAARRSGLKLHWVHRPEGPHASLTARRVDLWPLLSVQRDLWPNFHFTEPYLSNAFVSVAVEARFADPEQTFLVKRVASAKFPLVTRITSDAYPHADIIGTKSRPEALSKVCAGEADAAVLESRALQQLALERPLGCEGVTFYTMGIDAGARRLAIASLPESAVAADRLRSEVDRMLADGSVERILRRWAYFYAGEAEMLYRTEEARSAKRASYIMAGGLAILSALLFAMLIRVRNAKQAAIAAAGAKSMFVANMSHEIRTPMNGVIGMMALASQLAHDEEQKSYLNVAQDSANSLLALLNDILDLSRIEAGKLTVDRVPMDPSGVVTEAVRMLELSARAKGLSIRVLIGDGVPKLVLGDPVRVRQVLVNLIGNSVKFTPAGNIDVGIEATGSVNQLQFKVRDSGIGIAKEQQKAIFEAFTQADGSINRKFGGSGLGLTISLKLIHLMGGSMHVESEPGEGALFAFTIPIQCVAQAEPAVPKPATVSAVALPPLRILLAEDNPVNQRVAGLLLQKNGHTVTVAANGKQALDLFQRQEFDLILMDVQMPELDGLQATATIREREAASTPAKRIPIIAMTAHAMAGDRERCLDAGMDGYVSKPVRIEELLSAIREVLATHVPAP